jgi:photosystem II stability/assembly factor-like uncharacterized protein
MAVRNRREVSAMTMTYRTKRCITLMIVLATACAFNVAEGNHYILPCRDQCDGSDVDRWTPIGPDGANVVALAVDPVISSTAFAGTVGAGVLKSVDSGATWASANGGLPTLVVSALVVDRTDTSTLYAGTDMGVFKSTDAGEDWDPANFGLEGPPQVHALAVDPGSPSTLYAGTTGGVFKTTNGGASWALLPGPPGEPQFIAVDPTSPSTLYVSVYEANVYKSIDAGISWTKIVSPYDEPDDWPSVSALVIDPQSPSRLYLATGIGVITSRDGGESWSSYYPSGCDVHAAWASGGTCWTRPALAGNQITSLAIDPTSSATVYAGTADGQLFQTADGGDDWTPVIDGPLEADTSVNVIAAPASAPGTVYVGGRHGIIQSLDRAKTWRRLTLGVRSIPVDRLAVDPTAPSTIYTTDQGYVAKTTDGGKHWSVSGLGLSGQWIKSIVIDPASASTIYVASSPIFRSTDAGAHWVPVSYGLKPFYSVNALAIAPSLSSTLYIGVNFVGLLKSTDGGTTWSLANNGYYAVGPYVSALAVDPTTADTVYVASPPTGGNPNTEAKIFKSVDGAAHWSQFPIGLPENTAIHALVIDPTTPSTIYVGYDGYGARGVAVFKSTDGGETWRASQNLLAATAVWALAIDPSTPSHVYAATTDGVFRSIDGGMSWTVFNSDLPILDVWDITIDRDGTLLRIATAAGIYENQHSVTWPGPIAAGCGRTNGADRASTVGLSPTTGATPSGHRRSTIPTACNGRRLRIP